MDEASVKSIIGMDLKSILVEQLHAYQSGEGWKYLCGSPVLPFQFQGSSERPVYWILSWTETAEGDDQLLIDETHDADTLSRFERVEGFREPVIVSSSIHLERARVQRVIGYGYKDEKQEFLTSIVVKLENVYVTFISGPVFTVTVTNTFPENMDRELFRVGM
ncbi:hypothetical protein DVB69_14760 [Sporosarcina sp. BI001-red]|uniref:hypothetical protein n=1 Tax=Sporosarcina sp. BI001-red TaxID=2282866 RepID=UPI000E2863BB|nr:hypothetical protein [Sporosarcina sp. BI001-red]REB05531.1 hypothetical protein DVB69_14760 [Sporosarcina sp. BI001-red]